MARRPREVFDQHLAPTTPFPLGLEIARAEGSWLYDSQDKAYLDLIAGVAVSNLGHGHPQVKKAIHEQVERHLHVMVYGEYIQSPVNDLAEALTERLPAPLETCYFTNSGAEAIEGALKLGKRVTGRSEIISFRGSYHGSTHGALSVSGNEAKKRAFRPLLPDVRFLPFGQVAPLKAAITAKTAAVIVEPIQGDAGIRIPERAFLQELRHRCDETGALLIFDEIQSGMGRTGELFAFRHWGVVPDVLCTAKALGGGLPLGAFIARKEHMRAFTAYPMLGHITTFGGNPVSCAAALATLEALEREALLEGVEAKGAFIETALQHPRVKEIRRKGLFMAIEFATAQEVQHIVTHCLARGVITFWFLSCPESFRLAPPLNISEADLKHGCAVIREAIEQLDSVCL
ncbi:MAG: aspartate aminotransferase family protein [Schleiferiaceae bacterium]|nr:aspartate aminotransferase family protein [Schleiferiaceae bacterium]